MTDETDIPQDPNAPPRSAQYWTERLSEYRSAIEESWKSQRDNLDRLYARDERADCADREYAIFWANIEVLKEASYARVPVPVVAPRFKGGNPLASMASEALERCLVTSFEQADLDGCLREVRNELLRYSRGSAWLRIEQAPGGWPRIAFDHVTADDFAHDPARTWREVRWIARRAWLTQDEGAARFDAALAQHGRSFAEVPKRKRDGNAAATDRTEDKAPVWEIWCKATGLVHFVSEDFDIELDTVAPWLALTNFWPAPRPAFGTTVPGKLKPVPDIRQYKDQIEEINEYTARIAALSEKLRLQGFYPAGLGEISDAIEAALKSTDNRATLVPVSSWAALGGVAPRDMVIWLPVRDALELVRGLVELRRVVIDDVYQITGISDILRGDTVASETATAQSIKAHWGALRVRGRQNELSRFARDLTRIAAEIIAENFPPELIAEMAQIEVTPQNAAALQQAYAFLRNDRARGFVIEIETDSTILPDENAEKQRRVEFVTAIGGLFQQALPALQAAPQIAPFIGEVLKFTAQGFRAGRPLEGAIDQLVAQMTALAQQAMAPKGAPPPDPAAEAAKQAAALKLMGERARAEAAMAKANASVMESEQRMAERAQR
jgi:hypothetical protein